MKRKSGLFQKWYGMKPTTPIISGGMNALRLPGFFENLGHGNVINTSRRRFGTSTARLQCDLSASVIRVLESQSYPIELQSHIKNLRAHLNRSCDADSSTRLETEAGLT